MFSIGITVSIGKIFTAIGLFFTMLWSCLFPSVERFVPTPINEPAVPSVATLSISQNGVSDYSIIYDSDSITAKTAADYLSGYLNQIGGVNLTVQADIGAAQTTHEILIGKTNREGTGLAIDRTGLGEDGIIVRTVGEKLVLTGNGERGNIYAVFNFLEKYLGCRWFTKDCIKIPTAENIEIPRSISLRHVPTFEYRETDWLNTRDTLVSVANGMNGTTYRTLSSGVGGGIGYSGGLAHTLTNSIVSAAKYFDSHPEYFALRNGERTRDQLCLTNPDVLRIAIDEVQARLNDNPEAKIISLTQHDNYNFCQCENCKRLDDEQESHQGTNLSFVNAVANHFAEAYPNLKFDTFAYQYTRTPPKTLVPADNVIIRLCSIECCFSHPLDDPDCLLNKAFANDIKRWSEICDCLYIWDYTTNYKNFNGPFPNFGVMKDNVKFFKKYNVKGIYEEGNYFGGVFGEFNELRGYVLMKLLWDSSIDYDACIREFCEAYYGDAAPYIIEFIRITTEKTGTKYLGVTTHMIIFSSMENKCVLNLSKNDIKYIDWLWEDANSAEVDDVQKFHIRLSEIQWRYWKASNNVSEFTMLQSDADRMEQRQKLHRDMTELGITKIREGSSENDLAVTPNLRQNPQNWTKQKNGE